MKGKLPKHSFKNLSKLLNMEYTPRELSEIIGFSRRQVYRVYRKMDGFPHRVDENRHIWINGAKFREWYREEYKSLQLPENETYCRTCKGGVEIIDPIKRFKNGAHYLESLCPKCGRKLAKIFNSEKNKDD